MATGGREDNSEIDIAVSGSEAVIDHVCQPCSGDGQSREAVGFCVDCTEWLCDECFRIHKRATPARNHVLRDLTEMEVSISLLKPTGKCTEPCSQHTSKRLKYYCGDHEFLGCSVCMIQGHKNCKVDHIPDICESTVIKDEFQQVTAKLETVTKESVDIRNEVKENGELVKMSIKESVNASQNYIKTLKESLDDVGAALEETCEKHANEEITRLTNIAGVCDDIETESLGMKTRLEHLQNTDQSCNVFVALKQAKGSLVAMESKQKDVKRAISVTTYKFKPNIEIESAITGFEGIGTLLKQQFETNNDCENVQARHVKNIPVKPSKNHRCFIAGLTLLSPDKLVLTDNQSDKVKVISTKTNTQMSEYKVDGYIWDICKASDNSVDVTNYNKHRLLVLSVNAKGNISLLKKIPVNGSCRGVAVMDDKIVVTYVDPSKMEIMDKRGTVLQTIIDRKIVHSPQYVAANPENRSVYVSNCGNDTLTCVDIDGTLIATYKDSELQRPEQIAIGGNGMVYVTGCSSNNVHLLTPDCKKVKVILDESEGLKTVFAISYCEQTDKLYIGMKQSDVIKVFQLS